MNDVLHEPLISVSFGAETKRADLAQVLAWLSAERELTFTALQPHQHHPWHAFLVQLAALACARADAGEFPTDPAVWRVALLHLASGVREAWQLVVDDLAKPALLQPPVPEGSLDIFKTSIPTPDGLDLLLTTRNFDVKSQRIVRADPEHWLFALVAKQTFEGYSGKSNYGIARMNGGQSNRPCVGVAPAFSWAPRFRRDVQVWLEQRAKLCDVQGFDPKGHTLLWLNPWDGTKSLAREDLDPFFIEVCRRIRLVRDPAGIAARVGNSQVARIDAGEHYGVTGDIWTPCKTAGKKSAPEALTLPATGFHYRKLADLLFTNQWNDWPRRTPSLEDGPAPIIVAQALVRGQGKTEGYHQRIVPIPKKVRMLFSASRGMDRLGELAKHRIERAGAVRDRVLKPALCALLQGAPEKLDFRDPRTSPWLERFEQRIDAVFFPDLFDAVSLPEDEAQLAWDTTLEALAQETFAEGKGEIPTPISRRYRIIAVADATFFGAKKNILPELHEVCEKNRKLAQEAGAEA